MSARNETDVSDNRYLHDLDREVLRVRLAQLWINEYLKAGAFSIPVHLAIGHEAIAVAVRAAMHSDDALCLSHRNIHYHLAFSQDLNSELAELNLQKDGVAGGRSGSMNMAHPEVGICYASSILGNDLCVATGIALADKLARKSTVTFVVTGDGAMEEGAFYEAVELFQSMNLPAVIIVENNGWSLGSRISERRCEIDLSSVGAAVGAKYQSFNENDAVIYADALREIRQTAIEVQGPAIVEVDLASLGGWRGDPTPNEPDGKFINYHHGPARTLALRPWPEINDDPSDPVHVVAQRANVEDCRAAAAELFQALPEVVAA